MFVLCSAALYGQFLRYARAQNAHLPRVNSAFSHFASLELASYIAPDVFGVFSLFRLRSMGNFCVTLVLKMLIYPE